MFSPYTRGIAKAVSDKMLDGVIIKSIDGVQNMEMPATNNAKSEQLLVQLMTGLSEAEIDALANEEYEELSKEIAKIVTGKKK